MKRLLIVFLLTNIFFASGCHALRKKFVRKKKNKEDPVVYVDFKEYPPVPAKEIYQDYHLFLKSWLDELIKSLKYSDNYKKQKQAINEAAENLQEIIALLSVEGKSQISPLYQELLTIKDRIDSYSFSEVERHNLLQITEHLKREVEQKLSWSKVSAWLGEEQTASP